MCVCVCVCVRLLSLPEGSDESVGSIVSLAVSHAHIDVVGEEVAEKSGTSNSKEVILKHLQ